MTQQNYAFIKNNNVINVCVFEDPSDDLLNHCKNQFELDEIVLATDQTSVNDTYDGVKFWPLQPYPSWIKNEELNKWVAPIERPLFDPENPVEYIWNEDIVNWEEIQVSE